MDIWEHPEAITKSATSCIALPLRGTCPLSCTRGMLLIKPLQPKMGEGTGAFWHRQKTKHPTQGQRGKYVLDTAPGRCERPLFGTQRVTPCCTIQGSHWADEFWSWHDRENCFCFKKTQPLLPLSATPNLKPFCLFQRKQRQKPQWNWNLKTRDSRSSADYISSQIKQVD